MVEILEVNVEVGQGAARIPRSRRAPIHRAKPRPASGYVAFHLAQPTCQPGAGPHGRAPGRRRLFLRLRRAGYDAGCEERSPLVFGQCVTRVSLWEVVIMRNRTEWIVVLASVVIFSGHARLRAQVVNKAQEDSKTVKAMVEETVSWYQEFGDASATEAMAPQRVLRWQNGTRGTQESDGVFVLWILKGRPEASASIFPYEGSIHHEFVSLSRDANLVVRDEGRVIWSPATPGIAFKDITGAPAPAGNPAARLKQMKGLADRFKVAITGRRADNSDREELRVLPRPLYRYEPSEAPGQGSGWIDGGVFAFVQGTDPEAILLLEAVDSDGRPRWQYGFARATSTALEARLDKQAVWAVDVLAGRTTPRIPSCGSTARAARNSNNMCDAFVRMAGGLAPLGRDRERAQEREHGPAVAGGEPAIPRHGFRSLAVMAPDCVVESWGPAVMKVRG